MIGKMNAPSHSHPLYRLACCPFKHAEIETFVEFALLIWYSDNLRPEEVFRDLGGDETSKRRAIYLIDRFRRYPCLTDERAEALRLFVMGWDSLKRETKVQRKDNSIKSLDKLALEWGLDEDVVLLAKHVLKYQTRHYAATVGMRTGY